MLRRRILKLDHHHSLAVATATPRSFHNNNNNSNNNKNRNQNNNNINRNNNNNNRQNQPSNNNNSSSGNSAHRFGNLLRNEDHQQQQQHLSNNNNAPTKADSSNNSNSNRPFVRDIRSLRNRVKLDTFVEKRNFVSSMTSFSSSSSTSTSTTPLPSLRPPFVHPSSSSSHLTDDHSVIEVNETISTLTDRNGYVTSDESLFQALKMNADSGDLVSCSELVRRMVVENRRDKIDTSTSSSSPSSLLFVDALYSLDLLLQSSLFAVIDTARPMHSEMMKFAVWNNNNNNNNIFDSITTSRHLSNPFLALRSATMTKSISTDSTSAVGSDFFSSSSSNQNSSTKSSSSSAPAALLNHQNVFFSSASSSSLSPSHPAGVSSAADLSSLLLAQQDEQQQHLSTCALHHSSTVAGSPYYTALRPYLLQVVENLFKFLFLDENNVVTTKEEARHPVFISLFSTCVALGVDLDMFSICDDHSNQANSLSLLNIQNVFKIASEKIFASSDFSISDSLAAQLDGALFSAYRQVFFYQNILLAGGGGGLEKQEDESLMMMNRLRQICTVNNNNNKHILPMTSMWVENEDNNKNKQLSLIQQAILFQKQLIQEYSRKQLASSDPDSLRSFVEKSVDEALNKKTEFLSSSSSSKTTCHEQLDELFALTPLLLGVLSLPLDDSIELVSSTLSKVISSCDDHNNNNNQFTTFCTEFLCESFLKKKQELSFRANCFQIEDVHSTFVNESRLLCDLRISLLATELYEKNNKIIDDQGSASTAKLSAVLKPHVVAGDTSSLRAEIAALEKRSQLRREEIFGKEENDDSDDVDDNGEENQEGNNSSISNNNADDDDDDLFGTTSSTSSKINKKTKKTNTTQQQDDEEDEFEKLLAATSSSSKSTSKQKQQEKDKKNLKETQNNASSSSTTTAEDEDESSSELLLLTHPALRALVHKRRMMKKTISDNTATSTRHQEGDAFVVSPQLNSTTFGSVFHSARETGDVEMAKMLSENRNECYDPVKLI